MSRAALSTEGRPAGWVHRSTVPILLVAWFALSSIVVSTLMVGHWVPLPQPDRKGAWAALAGLRSTDAPLLVVHVLYADCSCSRRIFDHLVDSDRPARAEEVVLLVGQAPEFASQATAKGIRIHRIESQALKTDFGIESAPLLAVLSSRNVEYIGGYTERKQGPAIQDVAIIERIGDHLETEELPLFGCGVSAQLQALLDPLHIKYQPPAGDESR